MDRMISMILIALAVGTCLSAQDPQADETRQYDIRAIAAALAETSSRFQFTTPPNRSGGSGEASVRYLWGEQNTTEPDDDAVERLVSFALGADLDQDAPRDRVSASRGRLTISGPARFHEQAPGILAELHRTLSPTLEVELSILPTEALAATSSAVLDAGKVQRLIEVAKPIATMRTRLRPGSETLFEAVARRAYVKDYDTEIAEGAKAADPLIDVIPEGTRVMVRVDRLPGGAFIVGVKGQQSDPNGPPRLQMVNFDTQAVLQLPRMWWTSTSASARIEQGAGLLVGNDMTPRSVWLIRVFAPTVAIPSDTPPVRVVPISAGVHEPLDDDAPFSVSPNPSGAGAGAGQVSSESGHDRHRLPPESFLEQINALPSEGAPQDQRRAAKFGKHIALQGGQKFVGAAEALVTRLIEESTRGYTMEFRTGALPTRDLVVPALDELETLAAALPHRAVTAGIAGDRVILVAGESHSYLKDRDIEIAHAMTVDDPIVDVFFTGLSMSSRVLPAGPGRCAVDVHFEYQELIELSSVATGSKEVPETELPRIASVRAFAPIDVAVGSWTLVHSAPLEGTDKQLVVMIRVREA